MEAISARYICGNYSNFSIDCTKNKEYYSKPEADAEITDLRERLTALLVALEVREIDELMGKSPEYFAKLGEIIKDNITERDVKIVTLRELMARLVADKKELAEQSNLFRRQRNEALNDVKRLRSALMYISEKRLGNYSHLDFYDIQEIAEQALGGKEEVEMEVRDKMEEEIKARWDIPKENTTCWNCADNDICKYAFDPYNTDGDCLASK